MNRIDDVPEKYFFAELLLPLRHVVARQDIHYLQLSREQETYWRPVATRTGGMERLQASDCGGDAMLRRLEQYWRQRGDAYLPRLIPYLMALRREINRTAPKPQSDQPPPSEFTYTLF